MHSTWRKAKPSLLGFGRREMETSKCGLSSADRLRVYRRCFHDLDEQLVQLQGEGCGPGDVELQMLQAEIQCLEELIMIFTDIMVPSAGSKATAEEWCSESVDGLNLSLVTDILMLSATSPWTVYIAERSQWQICYVSPSVKRVLGWKTSELVGTAAWDGVHPEDVPILQRMLLFKEFSMGTGNSMAYRRARKDRTYATVYATGRAVGTRWYAWVEQDAASSASNPVASLNSFNQTSQAGSRTAAESTELQLLTKVAGNVRSRRVSGTKPSIDFDPGKISGGSMPARPASPLASLPGLERQSRPTKARVTIAEPEKTGVSEVGWEPMEPASEDLKGVVSVSAASDSLSGLDERRDQGGVVPKPPSAPSPSGSSHEELNILLGKKVLLVEDDRINRTIAQKLLENLKCNVTVACNGREALDMLQSAPPPSAEQIAEGKEIPPQFDLVLMDLLMPVMDGTKAVLHFRDWEALQEPPRKRMTVFALTSNVSDGDMVKCAISGFDEFVSKPLTIDKLMERLAVRKP